MKFSFFIFIIVVIGGIIYSTKGVFSSIIDKEIFSVKKINIYNNKYLTDQSVLKICQLDENNKIVDIDLKKLKKTILDHGFINDVELRKNYPSTLEIYLKEKTPIAFISEGKIYAVDENGTELPELDFKKVYDIPVITGLSEVENKELCKKKSLDILKKLKDKNVDIYRHISEINFNEKFNITLYLCSSCIPVQIGEDNIDTKLKDLKYFMNYLSEQKKLESVKYIDLRFKGQIITKEISKI
ncbi:cell division protein FtsQ/DivIB [candidate division KSB1 bacterium]